jgi:arylsulfatase A-like enzyme
MAAVSVGQKLVEGATKTQGGYLDAMGTPTTALLSEIQYVDSSIAKMVAELKAKGLYNSTLIIITAKHGQSPININTLVRIPADNKSLMAPSSVLGSLVAHASEDDVSLLWLTDQTQTASAVNMLQANLAFTGGGEIFAGRPLSLMFNDPATDSRTPDIIITPNIGVVYTGGMKKVSEHGGFANDDTNVIMLVANPGLTPATNTLPVRTAQVAATILKALGLNPQSLQAVQIEGTTPLPGLPY